MTARRQTADPLEELRQRHGAGCTCPGCEDRLPCRYEKNRHPRECECVRCVGPLNMPGVPASQQRDVARFLLGLWLLRAGASAIERGGHVCEGSPYKPRLFDCLGCRLEEEAGFMVELLNRSEHVEMNLPGSEAVQEMYEKLQMALAVLLPTER